MPWLNHPLYRNWKKGANQHGKSRLGDKMFALQSIFTVRNGKTAKRNNRRGICRNGNATDGIPQQHLSLDPAEMNKILFSLAVHWSQKKWCCFHSRPPRPPHSSGQRECFWLCLSVAATKNQTWKTEILFTLLTRIVVIIWIRLGRIIVVDRCKKVGGAGSS